VQEVERLDVGGEAQDTGGAAERLVEAEVVRAARVGEVEVLHGAAQLGARVDDVPQPLDGLGRVDVDVLAEETARDEHVSVSRVLYT